MYKPHKCKYFRELIINLFEFEFWPFFSKSKSRRKEKNKKSMGNITQLGNNGHNSERSNFSKYNAKTTGISSRVTCLK